MMLEAVVLGVCSLVALGRMQAPAAPGRRELVVEFRPMDSLLAEDRKELWLLNGGKNQLAVLDLETGAISKTIDLDFEPSWLTRRGTTAWVVGRTGPSVAAVDVEGSKVLASTLLPRPSPLGLAALPLGKPDHLYVLYESAVLELDFGTLKTTGTIELPSKQGARPRLLSLSADGSRMITTDLSAGTIGVYTLEKTPQPQSVRKLTPPMTPGWFDPSGQFGFGLGGPGRGAVVSLLSGSSVSDVPLGGWAFHPDLPYGVYFPSVLATGPLGFFSLVDGKMEGFFPPEAKLPQNLQMIPPDFGRLHLDPASGRGYQLMHHQHYAGQNKASGCNLCRSKEKIAVLELPLEKLKHKKSVPLFQSFPTGHATLGKPYRYTPTLSGEAALSIEPLPEGATWDPQSRAFEWTPKASDLGQTVEMTCVARAGDLRLEQRWSVLVCPPTLPVFRGQFRLSGDGKWVYGAGLDHRTEFEMVDLPTQTVHKMALDQKATGKEASSIPNPNAVAELDGIVYIGTDKEFILRVDLKTQQLLSPLKTKFGNASAMLSAGSAKHLLVSFIDAKAHNPTGHLSPGGAFQEIELQTPLDGAEVSPDGKTLIKGAEVYQLAGNKFKITPPRPPPPFPGTMMVTEMQQWRIPSSSFSRDGRHVLLQNRIFKPDLKTVEAELGQGAVILDRTQDRYLFFREGVFQFFQIGSDKPFATLKKEKIALPPGLSLAPTDVFLSSSPNALILVTVDSIILVPLP